MKKSLFIAQAKPIKTVEEAESFIAERWSLYTDATHVVYAWLVGKTTGQIQQRFSDNGEPQGTSGPPVFDVLSKGNIFDAIITVTRFFGGTLLGTGGLVKAYGTSASLVLEEAGLVEMVPGIEYIIDTPYNYLDNFNYQLNLRDSFINVINQEYSTSVKISCIVDIDYLDEFFSLVNEIGQRQATLIKGETRYQAKPIQGEKDAK